MDTYTRLHSIRNHPVPLRLKEPERGPQSRWLIVLLMAASGLLVGVFEMLMR